MNKNHPHIPLRAGRDRMIDLLGIAKPFPLRDLHVVHNQKVNFDSQTAITIENSQENVDYWLHNADHIQLEAPVSPLPQAIAGTGAELVLFTPKIQEDVTYSLLARRFHLDANAQKIIDVQNFLHHKILLRVGLDTSVIVHAIQGNQLMGSRIWIDYNSFIQVQIGQFQVPPTIPAGKSFQPQEGVTYSLLSRFFVDKTTGIAKEEEVISIDVPQDDDLEIKLEGKRDSPLKFQTKSFQEDTQIEVSIYKTDETNQAGEPNALEYLDSSIQVYVRPNPARPVTLNHRFILTGDSNQVTIPQIQASDSYQLFARKLTYSDYHADGSIILPQLGQVHSYTINSTFDSPLSRLIGGIDHLLTTGNLSNEVSQQLSQAKQRLALNPPKLNPNELRELMKTLSSSAIRALWPTNIPWVEDALDLSITQNLIDQDVFFAIRASKWEDAHTHDPSSNAHSSIWLDQTFAVQVIYTGLKLNLLTQGNKTPRKAGNSQLIDFNTPVQIKLGRSPSSITASNYRESRSQNGVSYLVVQIEENVETPVSPVLPGNGQALFFNTTLSFQEDSLLKVKAFQTNKPELWAYLDTDLHVLVRPNPTVILSLDKPILSYNEAATISINRIQASVSYQLLGRELSLQEYLSDGRLEITDLNSLGGLVEIASPQSGTEGSSLSFDIGQQQEDSVFLIRASKIGNGASLRLSEAKVALVRPKPEVQIRVETPETELLDLSQAVLADTQSGVNYQLFSLLNGTMHEAIAHPGFHFEERGIAEIASRRSYGLRIGIDFIIGNQADNFSSLAPQEELLLPTSFEGLAPGRIDMAILAKKTYTGLEQRIHIEQEILERISFQVNYLQLAGSSAGIEIPDEVLIQGDQARTVEAWIKTTQAGRTICSWGGAVDENDPTTAAGNPKWVNGSRWIWELDAQGALQLKIHGATLTGIRSLTDGQWHHIVCGFDPLEADLDRIKFYINGYPELTSSNSTLHIQTGDIEPLRWGNQGASSSFNGGLSDLRIWDRALSLVDIQLSMFTRLGGSEAGLVSYWKLDQENGDEAESGMNGGKVGILTGASWQ